MKALASKIESQLQIGGVGYYAAYEDELQRIWPLSEKHREAKIAQFAREHGFRLAFYKQGLCAIFQKEESRPNSDETLLKKISRRNQVALNELYGRHSKMLRAVVDGLVHEGTEADDVLQEIFLQIWKKADNYSPKAGRPIGWMVTIARCRAIDRLRRRQAYFRAQARYRDMLECEPAGPRGDAEKTFVLSDLRQFLKKRIQNLPRFQREAIELAFFNGLSHREIAAVTKTPMGTVKTRLELGLQKLTQAIRPLRNKI